MNKTITQEVELPSHWASALINNDRSGLSDEEEAELDDHLRNTPHLGTCLSVADAPFTRRFQGPLTECLTYTFAVNVTRTSGDFERLVYPARKFDEPLAHHKVGLQWTASGYGKKIPTPQVVYLPDGRQTRRYRIYCDIYSNIGSYYVRYQGRKVYVD
jgi:hypothetical protein